MRRDPCVLLAGEEVDWSACQHLNIIFLFVNPATRTDIEHSLNVPETLSFLMSTVSPIEAHISCQQRCSISMSDLD